MKIQGKHFICQSLGDAEKLVLLRGSTSEVAETEMEPVASVRALTVNARIVFKRLVQNAEAPTHHSSPKPPKESFYSHHLRFPLLWGHYSCIPLQLK